METKNELNKKSVNRASSQFEAKEQTICLVNKSELSVTGTNKIVSLKPDLIQLDTVYGGVVITGENLELTKLDNQNSKAEISGSVDSIKFFTAKSKEHFFRKIFK